jgi:hypothetical protein
MKQTKRLEKLLKEYSGGLKRFNAEELNEASYTYAVRKLLEENKALLTQKQSEELEKLDNQAVSLWEKLKGKQEKGLFYLELLVKDFASKSTKIAV